MKKETSKFNIRILKESTTEVTRESDTTDPWDKDDVEYNHTIFGFEVEPDGMYWDFIMSNNPKGKTLYLVYVLYNTGDSFSRSDNCIELIGLYEDLEDAVKVQTAIEKDSNKTTYTPLTVDLPKKGVTETIGVSTWRGYFESFNDCVVMPVNEI